jgi:hypothetical protein
VNSNSLTRPLVVQPISTRANDICGYYFKEKGAEVSTAIYRRFCGPGSAL